MQRNGEAATAATGVRARHLSARVWLTALALLALGSAQCRTGGSSTSPHGTGTETGRQDPFSVAGTLMAQVSDRDFKLKGGPKPPRRVGQAMKLPFPPPEKPAKTPSKISLPPLKVLRTQPHGKVGLQNAVTVSFNQPMIPLASLSDLRKLPAPLRTTPRLRGKFRWLGTSTLSLEVAGRIPYSTRFRAWVPQGTTSEAGKVLARRHSWSFETPRLAIARSMPYRNSYHVVPDTAIALLFNQRIDVEKVFAAMSLQGKGSPRLRLVPRSRWKKLGPVGITASRWEKGRVMVVKPTRPLAKGSYHSLTIKAGLAAGEGPLPTTHRISTHFSTYGPLKVQVLRCGYRRDPCRPGSYKYLRFSNQIKSAKPTRHIILRPKVADLKIRCSWRSCYLAGTFKPQTRYTVTVRRSIEDVYEQRLGKTWRGSFFVGDARPQLRLPVTGILGLAESRGNRKLAVRSINTHRVTATFVQVAPRNVGRALKVVGRRWHYQFRKRSMAPKIPGRRVTKGLILNPKKNRWRRTGISADIGLGRRKPGLLFVELHSPDLLKASRWATPYRRILVQVTDLGLTARYDVDRVLVLVTGLQSGKPLGGVAVTLYSSGGKRLYRGKTDARGILQAPGPRKLKRGGAILVVATRGKDAAFLKLTGSGQDGWVRGYQSYGRLPSTRRVRSHIFTERSPYRPGETVHLTGILRLEDTRVGGGIEPLRGKSLRVKYWIRDARYQLVVKAKELKVDSDGVFQLDYKIPQGASLGRWTFRGTVLGSSVADGRSVFSSFSVLHYRTPEYKVAVKARGEPYFFGDTVKASVRGTYYHGTAMAGARVTWTLRRSQGRFAPPHNSGFRFGELQDWAWRWRWHRGYRGGRFGGYYTSGRQKGKIVARGEARLDDEGLLHLSPKLAFWPKKAKGQSHGPGTVGAFTLEAQVFDKSRQAIAGRKVMTVHPAAVYVGMRMKRALVRAGQDSAVEVVVSNLAGKRLAGRRVKIVATEQKYRRKAKKVRGVWTFRYTLTERVVGGCSVTSSAQIVSCNIRLPKAGYYRVRGETNDARGRRTRTVIGVYAVGKKFIPWKQDNRNRLELISDKTSYKPNETAKILIKSPFREAVGLLTVERNGIRSYRLLRVKGSVHVERVKIGAGDIPNLHVSVSLVRGRVRVPGAAAARDLGRPKFAFGRKSLKVSIASKRLTVSVRATPHRARPGSRATVSVSVTDSRGKPVSARLAVMLVDEGVLSLMGFRVPDPADIFHSPKVPGAALRDGRADLLRQETGLKPATASRTRRSKNGSGGGAGRGMAKRTRSAVLDRAAPPTTGARPSGSVRVADEDRFAQAGLAAGPPKLSFKTRSRFASTAYFNAGVRTDSGGKAELSVLLPENLTTFRVTAVAMDRRQPDRFGTGEGRVTVRRPLMLMPALPRFANFGDRFEAAVKVTNETGRAGRVKVRIQTTGARVLQGATRTVLVRKGGTEEVRFPVAVGMPGRARFRFLAYLGRETDAVSVSIPVNLPATTEAFATYGVTSTSVSQPVLPPKDALRHFGGLEMSFSSTALTGMQDAVKYLINYPWACVEQTASRIMPIFALRKILPAFRLLGKRNEDGDEYMVKLPERFTKLHRGKARAEIEREYLEYLARDGIAKLLSQQRYDGGFGYWGGSGRSFPYPSAYATYALLRGREAGYKVPNKALARAARYLSNFLNYRYMRRRWHWYYSWSMKAMAVWVLSEMYQKPYIISYSRRQMKLKKHLKEIFDARKKLPLFAKAMLLAAIHRIQKNRHGPHAELRRLINNAAIQDTPYKVHFREQATESLRLLMHSESRTDAIVLATLMEVQPDHPLVPKIVRGLIEARVRGRWETTQANAFALLALSRYYKHYEKVLPDYRLRAWLGDGFIGQTAFRGRSMRVVEQKIPMSYLRAQGRKPLILEKRGAGKLYFRLGLRYAPRSLRLAPEEQGFTVVREYEPVEGKDTVVKLKGNRYRVKAGKYVRVRLRIVVPSRRYFVAVDDPLPAGLEAVDLNLRTSASSALAGKAQNKIYDFRSWYAFFAFSHKEKRDDRVVLFSDRLPSGVYEYTYLARATTIGTFVVPPLKANEMYHPEVFGRNGTTILEVVK